MPVLKRGQHTLVVRQRRQHDADVKDLVRREEQVESSRRETFWNSVRAARFSSSYPDVLQRKENRSAISLRKRKQH